MPAFDQFIRSDDPDDFLDENAHFHGDEAGESLAATLVSMFAAQGDDFAVGLLVNSTHRLERWVYQGARAGQFSCYKWRIGVPPPLYAFYREQEDAHEFDDRDFRSRARSLGGPLMDDLAYNDIIVEPRLQTDPEWRTSARAYLAGEGVNNQANVSIKSRPKIQHEELWFRHIEEQFIYDALCRQGHPFMPLPVVMRANGTKRPNGVNTRIEPDFCVLYKGRLIVLEVDGGSHWETPADAEKRLLFLREHGAIVRRISANDCADQEKAALAIADIFRSLDSELTPGKK